MARSGKTGMDRISNEVDAERAASEALAQAMTEQAFPGVFSGGKQIIGTRVLEGEITFWFNDQSAMRVVGSDLQMQYKMPGEVAIPDDVIEGTAVEIDILSGRGLEKGD